MAVKKNKPKVLRPASKIYYLAIQEDPTSNKMDIKSFIKGSRMGVLNKRFELDLDEMRTLWQFAIVSYGENDEGLYKDFTFARTRTPVSKSNIDIGKLVANIVKMTADPFEDNEIFARGYILSPANKEMKLPELLALRQDQLALTVHDLESLKDVNGIEPSVFEFELE